MPDNFEPNEVESRADWRARRRALRRGACNTSASTRLIFAVALIAAGTLMFLSNIGLFPPFDVWQFWPVIIIIIGISRLTSSIYASGRVLGILFIVFGSLFLMVSTGIFHIHARNDTWFFSILLITFGIVALVKVLESQENPRPQVGFAAGGVGSGFAADVLQEQVIFGGLKRQVLSSNFRGGKLEAVFGGIEINLRQAQITSEDRTVTLECNAVFGSIELRVPDTWRVVARAAGMFGSVDDKSTANKMPGFDGPTLVVTGAAVFGSVEIKD